ncbi:hypothetical protein GCM10008967_10290 [Bacillus carboniphilus]|uniref:Uncharacterized protein n=1 Tax=Bacillus carboniphilus TaxID=86663 RepID=A0ABP3FR68_9BACI
MLDKCNSYLVIKSLNVFMTGFTVGYDFQFVGLNQSLRNKGMNDHGKRRNVETNEYAIKRNP